MEDADWKDCPLVSIDPEVMHGAPVFVGTRMPVEDAIENYYAYRELDGMSDNEAVKATLESFRTIPNADALRTVLAYEAAHEHQLQP
ncbi:MAG: DUF433 domain-containing protein [Acidobacteriaceae bacterium]|nr:DUF433 domain-containing protein [Acidobacteriaceae bacterium]MBV9678868.1 DUF433 domain-containing protein [Acidobacteriaceae bacterium]